MGAVQREKNAQIELDLSHFVIWLPPVSKCICFSRSFAEGWVVLDLGEQMLSLTPDEHMGFTVGHLCKYSFKECWWGFCDSS